MESPIERSQLSLTIVKLSSGWRTLLPGRASSGWRPIVTVCNSREGCHAGESREVQLGSDGQNPNLKTPFLISVHPKTKLAIEIWQRPQTKKKTSKRSLAASVILDVGTAIRRFGPDTQLELPLHPQDRSTRKRGQKYPASVFIKLRAPADWASSSRVEEQLDIFPDLLSDHDMPTSNEPSPLQPDFLIVHSGHTDSENEPEEPYVRAPTPSHEADGLRRRRKSTKKSKRYHLFSDTDGGGDTMSSATSSEYGGPVHEEPEMDESNPPSYSDVEMDDLTPRPRGPEMNETTLFPRPTWEKSQSTTSSVKITEWIAFSILPRSTFDTISIASTKSTAESFLDSFTPYHELRLAEDAPTVEDSDERFARVLERLKHEWYGVGASLVALAGLDATVFGLQGTGALFEIDEFGVHMIALSSVASGLGLCSTAWMIIIYSFSDAKKFQRAALDVYGTYTFFCLSCRVPAILMATAVLALTAFLIRVAWSAWPIATLIMSLLAGTVVGLQYLVWTVHSAAKLVVYAIKLVRRAVLRVFAPKQANGDGVTTVDAEAAEAQKKLQVKGMILQGAQLHTSPRPTLAPLEMPTLSSLPGPSRQSSDIADQPCIIGAALEEMEKRMPSVPIIAPEEDERNERVKEEQDVRDESRWARRMESV